MTKKQIVHRTRAWATRTVFVKLGANDSISQAVIDAYIGQIDGIEDLSESRDDARSDLKTRDAKLEREGRALYRKLTKWYAVARQLLPEDQQQALDVITTSGGGYTLPRVERRAKETRTALTQLPDGFTAADMTKAQCEAAIDSLLNGIRERDELAAVFRTAETNLKAGDAALDAENKRLYGILDAFYDVVGTVEYDEVHTIPTEDDDSADEEDDDGDEPSLPPEK